MPPPKYAYALPGIFALLAFLLGFVGTSCTFLKFTTVNNNDNVANEPGEPISIHFGYWYYQSWQLVNSTNATMNSFENGTSGSVESILQESCDYYPDFVNVDKNWKAARTFSVLTFIGGGSFLLLNIMVGCLSSNHNFFKPTGFGYLVCSFTQGMGLLLLNSNLCKNNVLIEGLEDNLPGIQFGEKCSLSTGANATIAAVVFWFAAAIIFIKVHPRGGGGGSSGNATGGTLDLDQPLYEELIPEHDEDEIIHGHH